MTLDVEVAFVAERVVLVAEGVVFVVVIVTLGCVLAFAFSYPDRGE